MEEDSDGESVVEGEQVYEQVIVENPVIENPVIYEAAHTMIVQADRVTMSEKVPEIQDKGDAPVERDKPETRGMGDAPVERDKHNMGNPDPSSWEIKEVEYGNGFEVGCLEGSYDRDYDEGYEYGYCYGDCDDRYEEENYCENEYDDGDYNKEDIYEGQGEFYDESGQIYDDGG